MQSSLEEEDAQMYAAMLQHHKTSVRSESSFMSLRQPTDSRREHVPDMTSVHSQINRGLDDRIKTNGGIHPLCPEECEVYSSLLASCDHGVITPTINHSMDANGDVEGFRFTCGASNTAKCLPVNRKMFFRTSMVRNL
jgi:hypothetical protein